MCGHSAPASASQWTLPISKDGSAIDAVTFTNWHVRKVVQQMKQLACAINSNFTDDKIEDFQDLVDHWFHQYFALVSIEGITNYIHLLGSGHLHFLLKKWRNLY